MKRSVFLLLLLGLAMVASRGEAQAVYTHAVQEGDTGATRLQSYMDKSREAGLYRTTLSWSPKLANFRGHSDAEIEDMIPDMLAKNEIRYSDVWDF